MIRCQYSLGIEYVCYIFSFIQIDVSVIYCELYVCFFSVGVWNYQGMDGMSWFEEIGFFCVDVFWIFFVVL